MSLIREFESTGNLLFRYRSYIPLFLYIIVIPVLWLETNEFFYFENWVWGLSCFMVSMLGQLIRALTIGYTPQNTSGRNTKVGQVAEEINTKGMYSIVRHPLYLGNFLMWLGLILYVGSLEFLIFSVFFFWIYYERIMFAEEAFIGKKFGESFYKWAENVPSFFPKSFKWEKTKLEFSYKNILKREYHGFYAIIISFALVNFLKHLFTYKTANINLFWLIILIGGSIVYFSLRIIVKSTSILHVKGR